MSSVMKCDPMARRSAWPAGTRAAELLMALALCAGTLLAQAKPQELRAVAHWTGEDRSDFSIEVDGEFEYRYGRLHNPERLYFDLWKVKPRLDSRQTDSSDLNDKLVRQIRIGQTAPEVTRVVLDLRRPVEAAISKLTNPARLLVELYPQGKASEEQSEPPAPPQRRKEPN